MNLLFHLLILNPLQEQDQPKILKMYIDSSRATNESQTLNCLSAWHFFTFQITRNW